jgi:hypothetical protein
MSKPPGIALGMNEKGLVMAVTRSTHAQDLVWDAVGQWQLEGGTPEQLKREMAAAWAHLAKESADRAEKVLRSTEERM